MTAQVVALALRGQHGDDLIVRRCGWLPGAVSSDIWFMVALVFVPGFFIAWIGISDIAVPLFLPVLINQRVDPAWLVMLNTVDPQSAFLTPLFGRALFYLVGVAPRIAMQAVTLALVFCDPQTALWVPKAVGWCACRRRGENPLPPPSTRLPMPANPPPDLPRLPAQHLARVQALLAGGGRKLLGLVGAPGAGKSTLASALQQALAPLCQVVPMDGFHLANAELQRLGRAGRKGAPDTFDSAGYAALLQRLRQQPDGEIVYAPEFRREIEEPVAGAIAVLPSTRLVITEGNYLLLDDGPWAGVAALLDEVWYVEVDDGLRTDRLAQRHQQFGRSAQAARDWVAGTDEPNARLVAATRGRAQHVFRWT